MPDVRAEGSALQVENLALEKWGGQEKLDAERAKRHEKRLERERAKAGKSIKHVSYPAAAGLDTITFYIEWSQLALTVELFPQRVAC